MAIDDCQISIYFLDISVLQMPTLQLACLIQLAFIFFIHFAKFDCSQVTSYIIAMPWPNIGDQVIYATLCNTIFIICYLAIYLHISYIARQIYNNSRQADQVHPQCHMNTRAFGVTKTNIQLVGKSIFKHMHSKTLDKYGVIWKLCLDIKMDSSTL